MEHLPQIRAEIDALPFENNGRQFLLYDRSGLSEAQLAVSAAVMLIINKFDGRTSPLTIRELLEEELSGASILPEISEIEEIVIKLDDALFLQNAHFQEYYQQLVAEFTQASVRNMICAGSVYPADPTELTVTLNRIIANTGNDEEEGRATNVRRPAPRGAIAPHMDYSRAAESYGRIYRELSRYHAPEAVVIIGTAHQPIRNRFAFCNKDFAVPGGIVLHHHELTDYLIQICKPTADFSDDFFAHRFEHSIELQAIWLRHIWGDQVRIIPILAGPLGEFIRQPEAIKHDAQLNALTQALHGLVARRRVMLLASADLAHIGPRFGDARRVEPNFLVEAENADRSYLTTVKTGSAQAGLENLRQHHDRYHLCGTGCIYALKAALTDVPGRLLGYQQAVTAELDQAVTCASLIFE